MTTVYDLHSSVIRLHRQLPIGYKKKTCNVFQMHLNEGKCNFTYFFLVNRVEHFFVIQNANSAYQKLINSFV